MGGARGSGGSSLHETLPSHLRKGLSAISVVFLLLLVVIWIVWSAVFTRDGAHLFPLSLVLPSICLMIHWKRNQAFVSLDEFITDFARGFSPSAALAFSGQLMLCTFIAWIYGSAFYNDTYVWNKPIEGVLPLFALLSWTVLACIDELAKLHLITACISSPFASSALPSHAAVGGIGGGGGGESHLPTRVTLAHVIARTIGFAAGMTIFPTIFFSLLGWLHPEQINVSQLLAVAAVLTCAGLPLHLLTAYLIYCRAVQRKFYHSSEFSSFAAVARLPILVRGAWYLALIISFVVQARSTTTSMSTSAWALFTAATGLMISVLLYLIRRAERNFTMEYCSRVGCLFQSYAPLPDGSSSSVVGEEDGSGSAI